MDDTREEYDSWAWLYDRTLGPDYSARKIGYFDRVLLGDLPVGARVLDLCCGTGQMMVPMLARGLQVTGLDLSPDMLRHARKNAPEAVLIEGDAREFTLPAPVDGVVCASASLNHIDGPEDLTRVFRAVFAALAPGGRFVFDINHPAQMARHWRGQPAAGDIGAEYAWLITPRYDAASARGAFSVDMYRRPANARRAAGSALWRAALRRPLLRRWKLRRLADFASHHPDWDHRRVTCPVIGHDLAALATALRGCGFDLRCETQSGSASIDADSAACFLCTKPATDAKKRAAA